MKIKATNTNIYQNKKNTNNSKIVFGINFAKINAGAARENEFWETKFLPNRINIIYKIKNQLRKLRLIKSKSEKVNDTIKLEIQCYEWDLEQQGELMKYTPSN